MTVDHGRNDTAAAKVLDGVAADIGAGPGGKFNLFCHRFGKLGRLLLECG